MNKWPSRLNVSEQLWTWAPAVAAILGLLALVMADSTGVRMDVALLPGLLAAAALLLMQVGGGGDDEDDEDEGAKTIVAMPAWMEEDLKKVRDQFKVKDTRKGETEKDEDAGAAGTDNAPAAAKTMAFSPAEAEEFRRQAKQQREADKPVPEPDPEPTQDAEQDLGTASTMMFDPAQTEALRETARKAKEQKEKEQEAPGEPAREAGTTTSRLQQDELPGDVDQTAVYSSDDVQRLREMMDKQKEAGPADDDANARTMAYMPAQTPDTTPEPPAPSTPADDEANARTVAYMPAVTGEDSTVAYSAEDKKRILEALKEGKTPEEAVESAASTQAYSPEQSQALRDAYDLLKQAQEGTASQEPAPQQAQPAAPSARSQTSTLPENYDADTPAKGGMGTVPLVIVLVLLLALAGGATAFILHLLGIIDLPVDLPQLDLFE